MVSPCASSAYPVTANRTTAVRSKLPLDQIAVAEEAAELEAEEAEAAGNVPTVRHDDTPVVLANPEVADKLGVAFLPSIPLLASVAGAGGGFLGLLSPASGASA